MNTSPKTTSASTGWRSILPIHPAAELFPRMTPDELRALGEDIVKNGLTNSIVLFQLDSKSPVRLLDGISRLDAIEMVTGCPVTVGAPSLMAGKFLACDKVIVLDGKTDPFTYVVSANINRRHLTAEDKRRIIAALIKANPQKSDRQIAKLVDASPTTVGDERERTCPTLDTSIDTKGRRQPRRRKRSPRKATTKPPATGNPKTDADVQAIRDNAAKTIRALMGRPEPPTREDIGSNSGGEAERLRVRNEELERENAHLRHEIEELREPALEAARCDICREKRRAMQRHVFVCDRCVETHGLPEIHAEAAPPDDGLDIPGFLDRTKQRAAQ